MMTEHTDTLKEIVTEQEQRKAAIGSEIESRVPKFLRYGWVDDPFNPTVRFAFGDFYLSIQLPPIGSSRTSNTWLDFQHRLDSVARKYKTELPNEHRKIWEYLATGETDATVYMLKDSTPNPLALDVGPNEAVYEIDLIYFLLRDGPIWAAYAEDLNILAIRRVNYD